MSNILHVNDLSFNEEVVNSKLLVLVAIKSLWSGPCIRILPLLENLAESNSDKIKVVSIDVDESPITAGKLGITNVPTLIIFKNGEKVQAKVGLISQGALEKFVIDCI